MELSELLAPGSVIPTLKASSKKQVLQELAALAAAESSAKESEVFGVLLERERLGTTGVGHGVAIPHGRLTGLGRLLGFFARIDTPVDFDAVDGEPVDLVFLLLAPEGEGADHLKALARISRLLRDRSLCDKLRGSRTADALYALITESATPHAA
jgi:PTS system nitrogen regulatory IIA component